MNIIDYAIIAIFVLFVLISYYEGFLMSVAGVASFFFSWLCGIIFSLPMAALIRSNESLFNALGYYAEGSEFIYDIELAKTNVSALSGTQINELVSASGLPSPLDKLVSVNLFSEAFANKNLTTVGEYFNQTIVNFAVNIMSFLAVFFIVRAILALITHGVDYTVKLPVLKHFDSGIGAGLGIVRGFFAVFVVFMLVPLVLTMMHTVPQIAQVIKESFFGPFFYDSNFLLSMIKG